MKGQPGGERGVNKGYWQGRKLCGLDNFKQIAGSFELFPTAA